MALEQRVIRGSGSLVALPEILEEFGAKRIFLVTGTQSFSASGAEERLGALLRDGMVSRFPCHSRVTEQESVLAGRARFVEAKPDVVLAVGGGRVLDTAKLVGEGSRPLVAVPTTAGSGAEATRFAAVYHQGVKRSVDDASLRPRVAILDPDLVQSMSAQTAAASGFDALSQAIESSWSVRSTADSRALAFRAVSLAVAHLRASVAGGPESRAAMAEAAHLAGRAIDITRTTAAHALSYGLTWKHGVPHGHAVAMTLGRLLAFNAGVTEADCIDPRGATHVRNTLDTLCGLLGCAGPAEARHRLGQLMADCGLTRYTADLRLGPTDLDELVDGVNHARLGNNPRRLDGREALVALFETEPPARGAAP